MIGYETPVWAPISIHWYIPRDNLQIIAVHSSKVAGVYVVVGV